MTKTKEQFICSFFVFRSGKVRAGALRFAQVPSCGRAVLPQAERARAYRNPFLTTPSLCDTLKKTPEGRFPNYAIHQQNTAVFAG